MRLLRVLLVTALALLAAVLWLPSSYGEGGDRSTSPDTPYQMALDAPLDISGTWSIELIDNNPLPFGKCTLTFTQTDESLTATGTSCAGVEASLSGSIDVEMGTFFVSGMAGVFIFELTGTTNGLTISGTWFSDINGGGTFTGTRDDIEMQPEPGDTDKDGCSDQRETGPDETLGGLRDFKNAYDFYDVAGSPLPPQNGAPDGIVDLPNDVLGVIQRFSPDGNAPYDVAFDRGPSSGPNPWNMTKPDGVIDLPNDILGVIEQFNHDCR